MPSSITIRMLLVLVTLVAACDGRVYVRDGVTDGNRFSLPTTLTENPDPVTQAWAAYSLARSVCQLEMGGENPARNSSLDCEVSARQALAERWNELRADRALAGMEILATRESMYLDTLAKMHAADVLEGYSWRYLRKRHWADASPEAQSAFEQWRELHLETRHKPRTRIVGSWGFASTPDQ
ncbi:MAG: hypothetical protein AAFR91_02280 [Pseudomonadota bacterium]